MKAYHIQSMLQNTMKVEHRRLKLTTYNITLLRYTHCNALCCVMLSCTEFYWGVYCIVYCLALPCAALCWVVLRCVVLYLRCIAWSKCGTALPGTRKCFQRCVGRMNHLAFRGLTRGHCLLECLSNGCSRGVLQEPLGFGFNSLNLEVSNLPGTPF